MNAIEILILAVVQGLTEFLPVSSSGHIVVVNALLEARGRPPVEDLVEVSIVLHVGTLLAVLVYYRREILRLMTTDRRVVPLLIVGTLPAALIGVPLKIYGESLLESPLLAGLMFPVTAGILLFAMRRSDGERHYRDLTYRQSLGIGVMQALALLPGISRSGSTIAGGLTVGLQRSSAGAYAFLLAIPAIGGAGAIEALKLLKHSDDASTSGTSAGVLALGFGVSFIVGLGALGLLVRFVQSGKLAVFAWYLIPLGVAVVSWRLAAM